MKTACRLNTTVLLTAGALFLGVFGVSAAEPVEEDNDNNISIYATACEPLKVDEPKSSIRVRATDKASFKAVEKISSLSDYRNSFSNHDFNVLVYTIVDNYIEDLTIRTTKQDTEQLCVEITGFIDENNIGTALYNMSEKIQPQNQVEEKTEEYPEKLEIEHKQTIEQPSLSDMPPKPQIKIKDEISAENILEEQEDTDTLMAEAPTPQKAVITPPAYNPQPQQQAPAPVQVPTAVAEQNQTLVFIDKTKFFNDTSTANFYNDLKKLVLEKEGTTITKDQSKADYVIKSEVLRAKVDPINSKTNRLQMVIAVELVDTVKNSSVVEHQNRFILFESTENEQIVAGSLMKKLLRKAGETVVKKLTIKDNLVKNSELPTIITPTNSNYGNQKSQALP